MYKRQTLNDRVHEHNIDFLLLVLQELKDERVREPIRRAMDLLIALQQPMPSPAWALQYTTDLEPAAARSYEPKSVSPHTTASVIDSLMDFYELTGERKYLEPVPAALAWLKRVELPVSAQSDDGRNVYSYVEIGTNKYLAVHRRGSNTRNGEYFVDYDMGDQHPRRVDLRGLKERYERLVAIPPERATSDSAWFGRGPSRIPPRVVADTFSRRGIDASAGSEQAQARVGALNEEGYWLSELPRTRHPYTGPGPSEPPPGFVDHGHRRGVGDAWDTSPFLTVEPEQGISTFVFIRNMNALMTYLESLERN